MKHFLFILSIVFISSCKEKCSECHKHDPVTGATSGEFEICDKNKKDYESAIKAAKADGFDCHEKLE